jgi:hypothetical protein
VVYDPALKRHVKTKRMPTPEAARNARADLLAMPERGEIPAYGSLRLSEARERFVMAADDGKVLNKHGHRYRPRAIDDIEEALEVHVEPISGYEANHTYPPGRPADNRGRSRTQAVEEPSAVNR